ncbi:MAG: C4-type zinc ribbon domain-containing protein [Dehalococcoidia bacterium]|nr:C4-type zinc ribbon domain-containing protein [Dehalococcoidia bacterium]
MTRFPPLSRMLLRLNAVNEVAPLANLRQLFDLQELDLQIGRYQTDLASVEARLADDSAVVKARADLSEREAMALQLRKQHASQSQGVQELQDKAKGLDQRLYGGSIRNAKELEALHAELQFAKSQASEEEEKLLNLMLALDEAEAGLATSRTDLEQTEKTRADTIATLAKEQATLTQRLQALSANRHQVTVGIAPALLAQYEQVRKARQGVALAKVERGMCMGCRLTLPNSELQRVRTSQEPVTCSSCGRILYAG